MEKKVSCSEYDSPHDCRGPLSYITSDPSKIAKTLDGYVGSDIRWFQSVDPALSLCYAVHHSLVLFAFHQYLREVAPCLSVRGDRTERTLCPCYAERDVDADVLLLFDSIRSFHLTVFHLALDDKVKIAERLARRCSTIAHFYKFEIEKPPLASSSWLSASPHLVEGGTTAEIFEDPRKDSNFKSFLGPNLNFVNECQHHMFHLLLPKWNTFVKQRLSALWFLMESGDFSVSGLVEHLTREVGGRGGSLTCSTRGSVEIPHLNLDRKSLDSVLDRMEDAEANCEKVENNGEKIEKRGDNGEKFEKNGVENVGNMEKKCEKMEKNGEQYVEKMEENVEKNREQNSEKMGKNEEIEENGEQIERGDGGRRKSLVGVKKRTIFDPSIESLKRDNTQIITTQQGISEKLLEADLASPGGVAAKALRGFSKSTVKPKSKTLSTKFSVKSKSHRKSDPSIFSPRQSFSGILNERQSLLPRYLSTKTQDVTKNVGGSRMSQESPWYALSLVMMIGMRQSLSAGELIKRLKAHKSPTSYDLDFELGHPLCGVRYTCYRNVPYMSDFARCQCIDFAPELFERIRLSVGVDSESYASSLCRTDFSFIEFHSNSKSGQFFFFSHDGRYLIKTLSARELRAFLQKLQSYATHLENTPNSLITRVMGIHHVTIRGRRVGGTDPRNRRRSSVQQIVSKEDGETISAYIIVVGSMYDPFRGTHHLFDLKGSLVSRTAKTKDKVKKDMDWLKTMEKLDIAKEAKNEIIQSHAADCAWFRANNLFDYSILLGIHDRRIAAKGDPGQMHKGVKLLTSTFLAVHWAQKVRKVTAKRQNDERAANSARNNSVDDDRRDMAVRNGAVPHLRGDSDELPTGCSGANLGTVENAENSQTEENVESSVEKSEQNVAKKAETNAEISSKTAVKASKNAGNEKTNEKEDEGCEGGNRFREIEGPNVNSGFCTKVSTRDGTQYIYIGLIDILTPYTAKRYAHTAWKYTKVFFHGEISPMPPGYYASRQIAFLKDRVFLQEDKPSYTPNT